MHPLWITRSHYDIIKSLEYVPSEHLLITTAFDKRVKLWDSLTGKPVDSFQQNYDRKDPRPIAYKRSGTEEIYSHDLEERVDMKLTNEQRKLIGLPEVNRDMTRSQRVSV